MPAVGFGRIIDGFAHWSSAQETRAELMDALPRKVDVVLNIVASIANALMLDGSNDRTGNTDIGIHTRIYF
jgi:hypothetical protein